jgi:hypothetical protein
MTPTHILLLVMNHDIIIHDIPIANQALFTVLSAHRKIDLTR